MFELDAVIDMHVHAAPDLIPRIGDDLEIAKACSAAGMAGMVVKSHHESTASRAYHVNKQLPDFQYVGAVCLNYPVGGINPSAVDACLNLGGKVVWMPSCHSQFHGQVTGSLGDWGQSGMRIHTPRDAPGLTILNDGQLSDATKEIVSLAVAKEAVIATSHLSPLEIRALTEYCGSVGAKCLVTHIRWTPEYDLALAIAAVEAGAMIEICCATVGGYANRLPLADAAAMIRQLSPENVVISSDCGSVRSPSPYDALRVLANNLLTHDITEAELRRMMSTAPAELLGLT